MTDLAPSSSLDIRAEISAAYTAWDSAFNKATQRRRLRLWSERQSAAANPRGYIRSGSDRELLRWAVFAADSPITT